VDFVKTIAIFVTGVLASRMIYTLVLVAPFNQTGVDVVLICVNQTARLYYLGHDWLDGYLLDIWQHLNEYFAVTLDHAQDRRFFFRQSATTAFSSEFSPSSFPFFGGHNRWMAFMPSRNVNFIGFYLAAELDWLFFATIPARNWLVIR